ncbi:lipopolysaccharide cholinephosphotransferase [Methanobrevibacter gottschalkii]|uniref:Lipopolysaccharide cholinephosphotransferase n=1 Tax=Methanobrevibacter gottschalkii TaxID=190974 RepID=A0A1H7LRP6_9EURY|nr:LicD family protein [Methanobrevibacter gottschalkii]SEL01590.1 lipopolysaccharide cholinephosphotransferase [Methanobrevibacter gottschalkii]
MSSNDEMLQHIKDVELLILKDFIKICDENNLDYYLFFGSEIGAVRHGGFIPWDDDIDVIMFRDDYEKFLNIMDESDNEKYTIYDSRYEEKYFFGFGRMSLNNTYWAEFWDSNVPFKMGIHIDVFILDKVPNNKIKRFLYMRRCLLLCKFYVISAIKFDEGSSFQKIIVNMSHTIFDKIGLKPSFYQKRLLKLFRKYQNEDYDYWADLTMNEQVYFKTEDFKPAKKVKFEDIHVKIPNNQDSTLGQIFGDYMTLPPEEDRVCHELNEINFGKY